MGEKEDRNDLYHIVKINYVPNQQRHSPCYNMLLREYVQKWKRNIIYVLGLYRYNFGTLGAVSDNF